jgi:hypothetical protein
MTTERHPQGWLILVVLCLSTIVLIIDSFALNVTVLCWRATWRPAPRTSSGSSTPTSWSSPGCC